MPLINSVLALLDGAFCLYYLVLSKSSNTAVSEVIATLSVGSRSGAHCGKCSLGSGTPDWREASSLGLRPLVQQHRLHAGQSALREVFR
jgi:hypothetical protein